MENELYHHGIKGMKWGVRRFQNEDGTLTSAGRKRRRSARSMSDDELSKSVRRMTLENSYDKLSKERDRKPNKLEKVKRIADMSSNLVSRFAQESDSAVRSGIKRVRPKGIKNMTDKELQDRINRETLERRYTELFGEERQTVSRGALAANKILSYGSLALATASSGLGIALAIKELRG